jgi:membrane-bound lytic murein transglycosylase A
VSRRHSGRLTALAFALTLAACGPKPDEPPRETPETPPSAPDALDFRPAHWDGLSGWDGADLAPALAAFRRSCARFLVRPDDAPLAPRAAWAGTVGEWREACRAADAALAGDIAPREAFESALSPVIALAVDPQTGAADRTGLLTGYYEPFVEVRTGRQGAFTQPLRRRPDDLVTVDLGRFDESLAGRRIVGEVRGGELVHYKDRAEIEAQDAGEIFAWGRPVDVFFLQIQGSGRLVWPDGRQERAAFAAHNGLPYRSIGRELIKRGELQPHAASKAGIERWLAEHGPEATAELFAVNPRYVFFETQDIADPDLGPAGASGVALTPMASIAVDPAFHAHGVPVWLNAGLPELGAWAGLAIAQDSGGAITGPLRGDFFWGWGETAERRAGSTRAEAEWTILLPHVVVARLFAEQPPV